ncbi:hypothetical protein H5410_005594 [Solanum commersonii]|uniref:Uncharacterized protein n=1 Tax=Solanum commersonii TaxID=4109 RepID=A0A9J6A7K3_SOLCO|nr:hypothetical protein H5410_005594 [Solanum commersonii]
MARDPGTYSEEIVRELYASYVATLRGLISKWSKTTAQDPLTSTMVRDGEYAEWVTAPRDSRVPIWHCDRLIHPTRSLDIGLIRDAENMVEPRREPQIEVPPLSTNLTNMVEQA